MLFMGKIANEKKTLEKPACTRNHSDVELLGSQLPNNLSGEDPG